MDAEHLVVLAAPDHPPLQVCALYTWMIHTQYTHIYAHRVRVGGLEGREKEFNSHTEVVKFLQSPDSDYMYAESQVLLQLLVLLLLLLLQLLPLFMFNIFLCRLILRALLPCSM